MVRPKQANAAKLIAAIHASELQEAITVLNAAGLGATAAYLNTFLIKKEQEAAKLQQLQMFEEIESGKRKKNDLTGMMRMLD